MHGGLSRTPFSSWARVSPLHLEEILKLFGEHLTTERGQELVRSKSDAHMTICFRACIEAQKIPMPAGYTQSDMKTRLLDRLASWSRSGSVFAKYMHLLFAASGTLPYRTLDELKRQVRARAEE